MGSSCAERQSVTIYFDICSNVIIHWYGKQREERDYKGNRRKGREREREREGEREEGGQFKIR